MIKHIIMIIIVLIMMIIDCFASALLSAPA